MALTDFKITDLDVSGKGVVAAPDQLSGTATENKKIFDRLIREVVKEEYNGLIDALVELGVQQLVQYGTENVKHIRLNEDENIEISADGEAWTTVASSGHVILDGEGNQAPQRGRLKFGGETTVKDEDGCTVVEGIMGSNVRYTAQELSATQQQQARTNIGAASASEMSAELGKKVAKDTSSSVAFSVGYDAGGLYVIA